MSVDSCRCDVVNGRRSDRSTADLSSVIASLLRKGCSGTSSTCTPGTPYRFTDTVATTSYFSFQTQILATQVLVSSCRIQLDLPVVSWDQPLTRRRSTVLHFLILSLSCVALVWASLILPA
eukprot:scpid27188/ scgid34038/ 